MYCPCCGQYLLCQGKPYYGHSVDDDVLPEIWENQKCDRCGATFTHTKHFFYDEEEDEYDDIVAPPSKRVKSRSRKIRYPSCPRCGAKTNSTDMKYNDFDDYGNLFECYVCPECPTRFSITYDGDNENCDWEYDQDSIESLSRKKRFFRRK